MVPSTSPSPNTQVKGKGRVVGGRGGEEWRGRRERRKRRWKWIPVGGEWKRSGEQLFRWSVLGVEKKWVVEERGRVAPDGVKCGMESSGTGREGEERE